jgi:hypothetical protein
MSLIVPAAPRLIILGSVEAIIIAQWIQITNVKSQYQYTY